MPSYIYELKRKMHVKEKEMEKKERGVTMMVGIILATFLICTMPAAIVLETDPDAVELSWVKYLLVNKENISAVQAHIPTYILSWLIGVTNPLVYVLFCQRYRKAANERFRTCRKSKLDGKIQKLQEDQVVHI